MKLTIYKTVIFTLAFIYVFASVGVSVISHYCGGELKEVAFFSKPDSCCGEEAEDEEDGCCTNETHHVSFQNDFTFQTAVHQVKIPVLNLFFNFDHLSSSSVSDSKDSQIIIAPITYPPPDIIQRDIVSVSVIRI